MNQKKLFLSRVILILLSLGLVACGEKDAVTDEGAPLLESYQIKIQPLVALPVGGENIQLDEIPQIQVALNGYAHSLAQGQSYTFPMQLEKGDHYGLTLLSNDIHFDSANDSFNNVTTYLKLHCEIDDASGVIVDQDLVIDLNCVVTNHSVVIDVDSDSADTDFPG